MPVTEKFHDVSVPEPLVLVTDIVKDVPENTVMSPSIKVLAADQALTLSPTWNAV
jgi:hypothetical protein